MSARTLPRLHPFTGARIVPVGHRKDGRPIWPILGGADDAPDISKRPDGVPEDAWNALGDPGKAAIVRERTARTEAEQARTAAEQALAAARAASPVKTTTTEPAKTTVDGQPDVAAIVQQAVAAALNPFLERDQQREAEAAAAVIRDAVATAASARFHDATDALSQVNLTALTDGNGRPDQQKITAALDDLLTRKPHLGKAIDPRRQTVPGTPLGGGGGTAAPLDDRVKATLARMQQTAGVKFADA